VPDDPLRDAILKKAAAREIKKVAAESGMFTLIEDGSAKPAGITTIEEILRMLYE